jgi:hypothetical protein
MHFANGDAHGRAPYLPDLALPRLGFVWQFSFFAERDLARLGRDGFGIGWFPEFSTRSWVRLAKMH